MVHGAPTRMGELAPKGIAAHPKRLPSDHPIERLHALLWMLDKHARRYKRPGSVGLITYKATCEYFKKHGLLPGVPMMHFGALRGMNSLQDVSILVVAGRIWPNSRELDRMPEGFLAFDPAGREAGHSALESHLRGVRMRGGGCEVVAQTEHASEHADVVLSSMVDAELAQAIGRARALRRAKDNPLHVLVLADRVGRRDF